MPKERLVSGSGELKKKSIHMLGADASGQIRDQSQGRQTQCFVAGRVTQNMRAEKEKKPAAEGGIVKSHPKSKPTPKKP